MKRICLITTATALLLASLSANAFAGTVSVTEKSYQFTLSTKSVKAGSTTFKVKDTGGTHGFCIKNKSGFKKCLSGTLSTGKSATLKVSLKKGSYTYYCPVDGHASLGMTGTLKVT